LELVAQVPVCRGVEPLLPQARADSGIDALVWLQLEDRRQPLACAVLAHGQPRHVRLALWELIHAIRRDCPDAIPLLIAAFLSPASQAICKEHQVAFLDHQGNARLVFDGIFIERVAAGQPAAVRRDLKNLFSPKADQVLRVLLRDPWRAWRVTEPAETAEVSPWVCSLMPCIHLLASPAPALCRRFSIYPPQASAARKPPSICAANF
jgi:hypothetical protein